MQKTNTDANNVLKNVYELSINELINKGFKVLPFKDKKPVCGSKPIAQIKNGSLPCEKLDFTNKDIAVIAGYNNLEVLDIDVKYALNDYPNLKDLLLYFLPQNLRSIENTLIYETLNKGFHIWYYCEQPTTNKKLAFNSNKENNHKDAIIEVRGLDGFATCPPSKGYEIVNGTLDTIVTLTPQQRNELHAYCKSYDLKPKKKEQKFELPKPKNFEFGNENSPFEVFNANNPIQYLLNFGFTIKKENSSGYYLTHNESTQKDINASLRFHNNTYLLRVFGNNSVFESDKSYNPCQVFALINGIDYDNKKELGKRLAADGFGTWIEHTEKPKNKRSTHTKKQSDTNTQTNTENAQEHTKNENNTNAQEHTPNNTNAQANNTNAPKTKKAKKTAFNMVYDKVIKFLENNEITKCKYSKEFYKNDKKLDNTELTKLYLDCKRYINVDKTHFFDILGGVKQFDKIEILKLKCEKITSCNGAIRACFDTLILENPQHKEMFCNIFEKWLVGFWATFLGEKHNDTNQIFLVVCGNNHLGKSYFFKELFESIGVEYCILDNVLNENANDLKRHIVSNPFVLFDDFSEKLFKNDDLFKSILGNSHFSIVQKYSNVSENLKKIASFCGTTNHLGIIHNTEYNRRIVPIHIKDRDKQAFDKIIKINVFAEALHLFNNGALHELNENEINFIKELSKEHKDVDFNTALILDKIKPSNKEKGGFYTATQIKNTFFESEKIADNRLGMVLKKAGFLRTFKKQNNKTCYGYYIEIL